MSSGKGGESCEDGNVALSSQTNPSGPESSDFDCENNSIMKRTAARKLIEKYYYRLTDGCGNTECDNANCASSGIISKMSPNAAAIKAFQLLAKQAKICDITPSKFPRSDVPSCSGDANTVDENQDIVRNNKKHICLTSTKSKELMNLTEDKLLQIIKYCEVVESFSKLVRTIGEVFSAAESLNESFLLPIKKVSSSSSLLKEEIREIEGDKDKDHDSMDTSDCDCEKHTIYLKSDEISLDLASLRRSFQRLLEINDHSVQNALINALLTLFETASVDLKINSEMISKNPNYLNMFIIISELPCLHRDDYQKYVVPAFCRAASHLSLSAQAKLARVWAKNCSPDHIKSLIDALHQLITCKIYLAPVQGEYCINDEVSITSAVKVLNILYHASIVGGELIELQNDFLLDSEDEIPMDNFFHGVMDDWHEDVVQHDSKDLDNAKVIKYKDPLATELRVNAIDCRKPLVPFDEFYHEPLSDQLEVNRDYFNYKRELEANEGGGRNSDKFSFMNYSFIITPATKVLSLYLDNRTRMFSERRTSMYNSIVRGSVSSPFLKLKVRRDYIIADALIGLEMIVRENPADLKKQLVVEFDGEQGIDEGGVSKEFFHLVVVEIFNPEFGMFMFYPDVDLYWFNATSFESDGQFVLIGIVIGLAIYNNVILDIHLPMVVYRKLFGKSGTFYDLQDLYPDLHKGLTELLMYEGDDIEEVFMQTFRIGYHDIFGTYLTHDLKENGADILVNQSNKQEFVDLYADFLLNKSIVKQFTAFKRGFKIVSEESPIKMLFRPEEVELLVCGSKLLNFNELEETTEYDGGYTADSQIIKQFWEIVHEFSEDQKRKLLQFCSGSDRVPVGGLSKLKLVICRNGDDSDRLPTAHTCFNVLLLPEYKSKEKLYNVLIKAIMYSKGFGLL